ncbi:MAG: DUF134 domain-containing protein [Bacteroidales bacterium]|jgi:predicted DNA-binding protein (UPF0251 family)|nr:DUF134 domain-containing protein [Bacteroidales bacterium]MDD2264782.1 DUF134 domain-containing protein [Bacteroidales bacterium]MDD2831880.1 DUF134 domain-containing protein [Bacteroidales bacterium]MDD3209121.1 DUF134 domain-containing protein [Bacteroidales bacterium]MDD3698003.1 DUF134 domain-containing protein [Bacteroidales bacterium]
MARPKKLRKLSNPPKIKGFRPIKPAGEVEPAPILLDYDEFEALRLSDYLQNNQADAAREMGISRPTFARIYKNARRKIARSFAEGAPILFQGGPVYFTSEWYSCKNCRCFFNNPDKDKPSVICPLCRSSDVHQCETDTL